MPSLLGRIGINHLLPTLDIHHAHDSRIYGQFARPNCRYVTSFAREITSTALNFTSRSESASCPSFLHVLISRWLLCQLGALVA